MLSLSNTLLLLLSEKSMNFSAIRKAMETINGGDRKVLWTTLSRLVQKGYLKKVAKKEGFVFSLTPQGKKNVPADPSFIKKPDKAWDQKWRIVIFDIPEEQRRIRDIFTKQLKEWGMGKIQNSVYLSPHDILDKVKETAVRLKIERAIITLIGEKLGIADLAAFAERIWQLEALNQQYKDFIKNYYQNRKQINYAEDALKLWLKKTRYEYLCILHQDPVLPKELLPKNWHGYEAEKIKEELETILATY
jgi:phenylacetic acid degradation operon negative regulatory protein